LGLHRLDVACAGLDAVEVAHVVEVEHVAVIVGVQERVKVDRLEQLVGVDVGKVEVEGRLGGSAWL
jgi:hypothetical protein